MVLPLHRRELVRDFGGINVPCKYKNIATEFHPGIGDSSPKR